MKFKRGDTFLFSGELPSEFPEGTWEAVCNAEDVDGAKYPIAVEINAFPIITLRAEPEATKLWPIGPLVADIQFTNTAVVPPFVVSSLDFRWLVIEDRTVT